MIQSLIVYFQFFTRIPINIEIQEPVQKLQTGVKYFTLFGLIIGGLEAVLYYLLTQLFPLPMAFLMTLFADVLLTGGFHLDALADMADGLFSARKKERMLEIMKDSRIGTSGVLALIFYYFLLGVACFYYQPSFQGSTGLYLIAGFNLIGKNSISLLFYHMKYAGHSENGLGSAFVGVKTLDILIAQLFTLGVLFFFFALKGVLTYFVTLILMIGYRRFVYGKVDGFNGDTLGAASPLSQVVYLILLGFLGGL